MVNADSCFSCVSVLFVVLSTPWAAFESELVTKRFHPFHASFEISGLITLCGQWVDSSFGELLWAIVFGDWEIASRSQAIPHRSQPARSTSVVPAALFRARFSDEWAGVGFCFILLGILSYTGGTVG